MEGKDMFYTKLIDNSPSLEDLPDQNATRGFRRAVVNSQPTLALQYLRFMLNEHEEKLAKLESEIKGLKAQASPQPKAAKKPSKSTKSTKKKTQEPVEQEPAVEEMVKPIDTEMPDDDVTNDDS